MCLLGRDGGVLFDQRRHHATQGFDTQGKRGDVEQQNVFNVATEYAALNRCTNGNRFVRVNVFTCFFAEEVSGFLLHHRHTCLATDQDHFVDFRGRQACIFQGHFARLERALNQLFDQRLQLGTSHLNVKVFRASVVGGDVRQVHIGLLSARQLNFGFFGSFFQTLHGQVVARQINATVRLELVYQVVDQRQVKVFAAQEGITVGGQHFKLGFAVDIGNFDDRDIEGAATQVVDRDGFVAAGFVHTVGQCGSGRLVNNALNVQTGNAAGVFGRLTLAVVEVGRYGNDRFGDCFAQVVFGSLLHFLQHFRAYLRRCHFFAFYFNPSITVISFADFVRHHLDVFLDNVVFKATAN